MKFFIRVKDGLPFEHPIEEENFIKAFPDIDVDNLPSDFAEFKKTEKPALGKYEIYDRATYELVNGVCQENHVVQEMSSDEKIAKDELLVAKKAAYKEGIEADWVKRDQASNWAAFVYDEASLSYQPPFLKPDDGKVYRWSGADNNWKESPSEPAEGGPYKFDFTEWVWVEVEEIQVPLWPYFKGVDEEWLYDWEPNS